MPEIVTDGTTPQMPLPAAEETYARQTNPGLGRFVLGTLQDAGTAFLGRAAERGTVAGSSSFDQGMAALTATGGTFDQPLISVPQPSPSPEMPPEQYNDLYAPRDTNGKVVPIGDKPMPEALAKIIGRQKAEAMQRESVLARYGETHSGITSFAVGSLASMLDPLNAGAAFLPAIGEGAVAARLGGGLLARTAARVAAGAEMGIAQQLPLSALKYGLSPEEASDYGLRDAMRDLAYGAAGVAVLHTGIGSIGEILGRRAGAAAEPAGERKAVSAPGVAATVEQPRPAPAGAAAILSADAVTKNAAMRGALGEISDGRSVDVAPIFSEPVARPENINEFLIARGGVFDEGGELRASDLNRPQKGQFGILSTRNGLSLDYAREAAEEAGYLRPGSTINDLLDAVQATSRGNPVYRPEDAADYKMHQATSRRGDFEQGGAFDPNDIFADFAAENSEGWAPSVSRGELSEANGIVYGPKTEAEAAPRAEAGADADLAAAEERAAQIPPESLHPEDQAALAASAEGVEKAGFMQKALETAAACIMGIV